MQVQITIKGHAHAVQEAELFAHELKNSLIGTGFLKRDPHPSVEVTVIPDAADTAVVDYNKNKPNGTDRPHAVRKRK